MFLGHCHAEAVQKLEKLLLINPRTQTQWLRLPKTSMVIMLITKPYALLGEA